MKYRLKSTANTTWPGYNAAQAGAGYLDIYAAVHGTTTQTANTGILASQLRQQARKAEAMFVKDDGAERHLCVTDDEFTPRRQEKASGPAWLERGQALRSILP